MDQIEYLGYTGSVLGYNLYTYCEGNPIVNADYEGTDAIYVIDFRKDLGLPIFGHAILYYQYLGKWYKTELYGNRNDASITNKEVTNSNFYEEIKNNKRYKSFYIYGDFSNCFVYANSKADLNYKNYRLFSNNCLHYVISVLKNGLASNSNIQNCIKNCKTIVPREFLHQLEIANTIKMRRIFNFRKWSFKNV